MANRNLENMRLQIGLRFFLEPVSLDRLPGAHTDLSEQGVITLGDQIQDYNPPDAIPIFEPRGSYQQFNFHTSYQPVTAGVRIRSYEGAFMAISDLQNMTRGNVTEPPIMVYEGPISDANGLPAGSGVIISQGPIHTRVDTITRSGSGDIIATQQVLRFGKWVVPMIADDATRTVVSLGDSASKGRALRYWDVATGEDLANGKNVRSQRASALGIAFPVQSA